MRLPATIILLTLTACGSGPASPPPAADTMATVHRDTVPANRRIVTRLPVASYSIPIDDPAYGWRFSVEARETKQTFTYLLHLQYKAMVVTDTLRIPDFGIYPTVEIHKGTNPLTCTVGFLDAKKQFQEYKLVSATGDKLKVHIIRSYYTAYTVHPSN